MPTITTTDGYAFTNWGPLTTTFTAPASCATATGNYLVGLNTTAPVWEYAVQCSTLGYTGCIPTGTASLPTTLNDNPNTIATQVYFSPGLHCPAGWATRGVAVRDANNGLSASGILSARPTPTPTVSIPTAAPQWENPATLLMGLLDPSETLVMCCPESMTADLAYGCYSTVSDYRITEGCRREMPASDVGVSTETTVVGGTTSKHVKNIIVATQPISVVTTTFSPSETSKLVAVSVLPMLSLVHHQSDLPTAAASKTAAASSSAARAAPNAVTWGGLGALLG
ncbi:hypothetical protein KXV92_003973 [Aspergillus fumigatus]|nr:hypothetical protein KXW88_004095 [Aspergillus fumigatus]KAH2307376.1 hypothetical protein KXV47_007301 [Aspergillus fumigatus]KAH2753254.1 hypothetical protein KXV94_001639 [Aspergillus fumigatus]KAH3189667.1 hypothetical protein KXV92_003973 [Aspergillus fumigatus]KAH3198958.1 hypothetical protein KXW62_001295 [Aspergillus fumigatus]